jgi:uncharacterized repeat protein (TIGR03803 family)
MSRPSLSIRICSVIICLSTATALPAQTFNTLVSFDGTNANSPVASLVQGFDGNFYGTALLGGVNGSGTFFKITPTGALTALYSFCAQANCADGSLPGSTLIQATDGTFFGTTQNGGVSGVGTIFKITPTGALTTLYSFCTQTNCSDGEFPDAGLIQATDGNFYGTTAFGGILNFNGGTIFRMTPKGVLSILYRFCSKANCPDGQAPASALVQATDGNFYGTTGYGGAHGNGTVFRITQNGKLTTLYSFCALTNCADGATPYFGYLIQATDGNFYGTTSRGGINNNGTIFKITPQGQLTTLYSFCSQTNCADGWQPIAGLIQSTDGNFYGSTVDGGQFCNVCGTLFITPEGTLTTLHSFNNSDGDQPETAPIQATDGTFYGTTHYAGDFSDGTVFNLSVGLRPFVKTTPASGKVGSKVIILGNNLQGSTVVTFNGTAATFRVVSTSEITTTVPTGATTGHVKVTTPRGTLKSNVAFRVR